MATAPAVSREALELCRTSDVVDLHVDSFIWTRLFGYDLGARHGPGLCGGRWYSQADVPRLREAGVTGALWSITTNPWRTRRGLARAFRENLGALRARLAAIDGVTLVQSAAAYHAARRAGGHAAFLCVQGGNALADEEAREAAARALVAVTLVHLTGSSVGGTSSPLRWLSRRRGLTRAGADLVGWLDAQRIFVDLAHIDRAGFFAAAAAHDRSLPLIATHTGVSGVYPHWRNLDDDQLRLIAGTGGVAGIIFAPRFLAPGLGRGAARLVVDHIAHVVRVAGEDVPALGSDWDGLVVTPRDMPTCRELPRLVERMLERGMRPELVQKVLGQNFLRALSALRG